MAETIIMAMLFTMAMIMHFLIYRQGGLFRDERVLVLNFRASGASHAHSFQRVATRDTDALRFRKNTAQAIFGITVSDAMPAAAEACHCPSC